MKTYPLTQTQLGIYLSETAANGSGDYNINLLYYLDNDVDTKRLIKALTVAVNKHPYLKSHLIQTDEGELRIEDHSEDAPIIEQRTAADKQAVLAAIGKPYDLLHDTLYRMVIYTLNDGSRMLYMDFHHILCDGMSCMNLHTEISKAYIEQSNTANSVERLGFEVAEKEEKERQTDAHKEAKQWYAETYGAAEEVDSMPIGQQNAAGGWVTEFVDIAAKETEIQACCNKNGVGVSIPFTTAFAYTMANYTANNQVLLATIWHGREKEQTDGVAMMVKTLPIYMDFSKESNISNLMVTLKNQLHEARKRTIYSFGEMVQDLDLHPRVCFAYHANLHMYHLVLDGREQADEFIRHHRPGLDLIVNLIKTAQGYQCKVEYNQADYSSAFIRQLCLTYQTVLNGMLTQADLNTVSLSDTDYNIPPRQVPANDIVTLFRETAKRYPDNTAVVYEDKRLTYRQLDEMSDRLAAAIQPSPGGKVAAIMINRSEQMTVCALGALKAGYAYQPLDPSYPQDRLNYMLQDSGAEVLICDRDLQGLISDYKGRIVHTDDYESLSADQLPAAPCHPESLFILLYTSGSTGKPKGVMLQHHNLVTFCDWYRRYYNLTADSRVLAYASFGFDADMMDLYPALTTGAAVVIAPEAMRLDLETLSQYMADNGVTHSFMTTQVGYQFATSFPTHPTLRHLSLGGEKMASLTPPTGYRLYNAYGPTECTIFSTIQPVTVNEANIPIGKPLDTLQAYIVNRYGQRLPWGAPGELIIVGDQVGHGYLNQPDKTKDVFVTYEGKRAYRSGDIVRYRENGDIEFVGRRDGQVKIRGFRIELKEVEAVIREYEGIKDCTVQAYDMESGGKYIAAYVVSDHKIDINALHAFIAERKPPYMVPTVSIQIDAIPLTINQKVDKKKLSVVHLELNGATEHPDDKREANILEKRLAEMVKGLTGQEPTMNTPLVYSGLSSILAMRLSVQLYKQFGIKIAGKDLMGEVTLIDVENAVLGGLMESRVESSEAKGDRSVAPLSFAQQGVYADCLKYPQTTVYNIPMDICLPLSVGANQLQKAVQQVFALHPMLFATLEEDDEGNTLQHCPQEIPAVTIESKQLTEAELAQAKKDFVRPFDLHKDRLFRVLMIETESALHLLLDAHHLVCDGASEDTLLRQIVAVINGKQADKEVCSYLQFTAEQAEQDCKGEMESHRLFFADMLREMDEATVLQADRKTTGTGHIREYALPLPQIQPPQGVTEAAFWFAATAYTIARYTGVKDAYLTTVSNGRQNPEVADTVGMFVNTLPVAAHIKDQTVSDFLQTVNRDFHAVIEHENYPFARIAADYNYTADMTFAYQLGIIADNKIDGQEVTACSFGLDTPKFKLGIFVEMYQGKPCLVLQYDDSQYTDALMQRLGRSITATATHLCALPTQPIRALCVMDDAQAEQVAAFAQTANMDVEVKTLHEGISRWAQTTPEAIAVIACDKTLTYHEYNEAANVLAAALQAQGVGRGDRIVLLLPRTSDFLVCMLAVMKCGAAFIPMDPEYPADRIAYILSDSEGRYVITTKEHLTDYPDRALDIEQLKASTPNTLSTTLCTGEDLAYMIYTSGSTGKPKGVMLQHKGICNYLTPHPANPHTYAVATEAKAVLCSATVSFDLSILEYGTALFNGKTVVFADEQATTDSFRLAELYKQTGADVLSGTPSRIETYMEIEEYREVVKRCKVIQMGGEKLPAGLMKRLQEMTKAKIFNMYGPTEITICCNADQVNDSDTVTVGKPLPNFTEHIVDSDLNELPAGVTGELIVSGVGVCPGYNNLPEKTKEAFITWHGARYYRTGDYAQWTEEGKVIILGRTDHQVKLNGLRIELGEIETVMTQQPHIKQCVVQVRKVGQQDKLVAYYVPDGEVDINGVKNGMAEHLTYYMVPSVFVKMDAFPITPAGKIDTKHLPEPEIDTADEYVAPQTQAEQDFCDIFAHVLQLERVGATDDFFALGGTSLVAIKVVIAAAKKKYEITYSDVFAHPTPQALAAFAAPELKGEQSVESKDESLETPNEGLEARGVLAQNTLANFLKGERQPLGTVLLTGATGYLGIHILYRLMTETDSVVYCPIRPKDGISPVERLRTLLFYYFSTSFEELIGNRLIVIEGEVTQRDWMDSLDVKADTVINCLANVKHFSTSNDIEFVNVESVRNLVVWCCKTGTRLVHISTTSVAGRSIDGQPDPMHLFSEQELEIGQTLDNRYAQAKYDAEKLVLDAVLHHGLNAKIMRVGNLSARRSDGEFQVNFQSNNFMATLRAYQTLGVCPYELLDAPCEFSPIDEVADAVLRLATTPKACIVFHPTNPHQQLMGDVLREMHIGGKTIRAVEQDEFANLMDKALQDEQMSLRLRPLMAYNQKGNKAPRSIHATNAYTTQVLHRLGFDWSVTSWDYVQQFIRSIDGLGYFDI